MDRGSTSSRIRAFGALFVGALVAAGMVLPATAASAHFEPCGRSAPAVAGGDPHADGGTTRVRSSTPDPQPRHQPRLLGAWPRFRSDAASSGLNPTETILNDVNVPTLVRKWRSPTRGAIESSPALAGGLVYVGSDDKSVHAFDQLHGAQVWSYQTGGPVVSSPAVVGGVVYVGSEDGAVYALNATTGKLAWKHATGAGVHSSPDVVAGIVYVGSEDGNLTALRASDGGSVWSFHTGGPILSSPAVFTQMSGRVAVYVGSGDGDIYAVDAAKGTELWSFATKGAVESSPAVASWNGGDILVAGSDDFSYYGLDADTGTQEWVCATNSPAVSSPAISVGMGRAYWGTNGHDIQGHDLANGLTVWSFTCGAAVRTSPAVANGVVYAGCGKDRNLYACREAFDDSPTAPQTDANRPEKPTRMIWHFDTGGVVVSSPAVSDGMVFTGSNNGYLSAFGLP